MNAERRICEVCGKPDGLDRIFNGVHIVICDDCWKDDSGFVERQVRAIFANEAPRPEECGEA